MAIKPAELFPAQTTPANAQYPLGSAKNVSSANENDGTPLSASWVNDWWGFCQKTLIDGNVTATGTPDDATNSQYLSAIKNIMSRSVPVGSIIFSLLSESAFNSEIALGTWVKLDGRDVTGSDFATVLGQNNVPDLQGKFIRAAGGDAGDVAVEQSDATARNGLSLTWSSANVDTNSTTISWASSNASTNTDTHNHVTYANASPNTTPFNSVLGNKANDNNVVKQRLVNDSHSHTVNKNQWNSNQNSHNHYVNKNSLNSSQSWAYDIETRPTNIAFNAYIKITY